MIPGVLVDDRNTRAGQLDGPCGGIHIALINERLEKVSPRTTNQVQDRSANYEVVKADHDLLSRSVAVLPVHVKIVGSAYTI